jgi:hypothetical protein
MGRGGAVATNSKPDDSCFGFDNENLAWTFFSAVAALIALLCFGMIEFFTGSGKLPSSDQCAQSPQFMNYVGNDMIPGGVAIADTQGQPGTLQCCQKCSVMPGAVMWVYHTPIAIDGTDMCFCKSKIGTGEANQQYIAVKIADPASNPWGGAFMMALGGAGLVYLVFGALINHQRGLRDMDMIPNGSLWAGLPSLVVDGVMFASSGFRSDPGGYTPVGPASADDVEAAGGGAGAVDSPSLLPDVEGLGAEIMERDERERKARKKASKKSKQKRGSVPSLTDETEREKERQKLKEKDKRARRKSAAVASPSSSRSSSRD